MAERVKIIIQKTKAFFHSLRARGQLAFWLGILFVVIVLMWGLTASLRNNIEMVRANKILEEVKEKRRLKTHISAWLANGSFSEAGDWYETADGNAAVIFRITEEGIASPFLALFNRNLKVDKLYPLSVHAAMIARRESDVLIELWSTRVERAAKTYYKKARDRADGGK